MNTTTKNWTNFFDNLDADDENQVSIAIEGTYYGIHVDDDFVDLAIEETGLLDDVYQLLTDREVIRNNNLCFEGETYLDLYGDGVALIGGFYFDWDVFKTLLNLEEELSPQWHGASNGRLQTNSHPPQRNYLVQNHPR